MVDISRLEDQEVLPGGGSCLHRPGDVVGGPAGRCGGPALAWLQPRSWGLRPGRNQKLAAWVPSREREPGPPGRAASIWEHPGWGQTPWRGIWQRGEPAIR